MMNNTLQEAAQFLAATPMCFIATNDGQQPRVRAFQYQFEQDGKLWFCTAKTKDVCKQLQANPLAEICAVKGDMTMLRLTGKTVFEDNRAVKERILSTQPLIKNIYGNAENPVFTTFHIEHGSCVISDFSGNPPRTASF